MGGRGFKSRSGQIFFQNIYSVKNMITWGVHCQGFSPTLKPDNIPSKIFKEFAFELATPAATIF